MEPATLLDALVELVREAGVSVKVLPRTSLRDGEPAPASDLCLIRGEPLLLLASSAPLEDRISAAARAARRFAPDLIEARFLPPAVRERLERAEG